MVKSKDKGLFNKELLQSDDKIELHIINWDKSQINKTHREKGEIIKMDSRLILTPSKSRIQPKSLTPSQSRIVERKQIENRLKNLSEKQLSTISSNLQRQNEKLKQEVETFSEKVKKLLQSKKYSQDLKPNPQIQEQILKIKKQLQVKYQEMKQLKDQIKREVSKQFVEEASTNSKEKRNEIRAIEIQLQELEKEKEKLLAAIKDNQRDFEEYLPARDLTAQIEVLREDNKTLKKKTYDISMAIKNNERTAKEALTKIYALKKTTEANTGVRMNRIKSLSVLSSHQLPSQGNGKNTKQAPSQTQLLQQQLEHLKRKKLDVESELSFDRSIKMAAKEKKRKEIDELLEYHKTLFKRRVRELTQLNYLEKKQEEMRQQKLALLQKANVPVAQRAMQTENIIKKEYRRDWIGLSTGAQFDDTQLLEYKQQCLIKSILVYRTTDRIVFIRFSYQHPTSKYRYQSKFPFQKQMLKKIENKKITGKTPTGYLTNLMVSMTKGVITRVQSQWSDGESSVQGWDTEESDRYLFDLKGNQRPIAFYGTVVNNYKGGLALQSLGCQILQQQE